MRTDVGEGTRRLGTGVTVVGEAPEFIAVDQPEMVLNGILASTIVGAEPSGVSSRVARDTLDVCVGVAGIVLGVTNSGIDPRHLIARAAPEASPFAGDGAENRCVTRDSCVTGELGLGNITNSGVEVLGGAIVIDVGEEVRWLDGELSIARSSEVIRSIHW